MLLFSCLPPGFFFFSYCTWLLLSLSVVLATLLRLPERVSDFATVHAIVTALRISCPSALSSIMPTAPPPSTIRNSSQPSPAALGHSHQTIATTSSSAQAATNHQFIESSSSSSNKGVCVCKSGGVRLSNHPSISLSAATPTTKHQHPSLGHSASKSRE